MTALSKKAKTIQYNRAETRAAWLLLLPSVIGLTCITYLPMLASFTLSLFSWNGSQGMFSCYLASAWVFQRTE